MFETPCTAALQVPIECAVKLLVFGVYVYPVSFIIFQLLAGICELIFKNRMLLEVHLKLSSASVGFPSFSVW